MIFNKLIKRIRTYYKVGELLHIIAISSLMIFFFSFKITLKFYEEKQIFLTILYGYAAYLTFSIFLFAQLDARSRFQNFKQIRDQIYKYGYQERILRPMLNSRCQRDAAKIACETFGYESRAKELFYNSGYRWYHIIPDFVFSQPRYLLTGHFWRTTFFVPAYTPINKYD